MPSKSNHETKSLLEVASIPSCLSSPGGAKTVGPTGPQHAGAYPRRRLESGVQAAQPGLSVCCFELAKSCGWSCHYGVREAVSGFMETLKSGMERRGDRTGHRS